MTIKIGPHKMAKTTSERDRIWNQTFQILCAHPIDSIITITVKTKCSMLGKIQFDANQLVSHASLINGFFPLLTVDGKPKPKLGLQFILWFKPADLEPSWGKLIDNGDFKGLRNATFPQRSNCDVILYHDAHHLPSFQPPLPIHAVPKKLWEDVYKALEEAKHIIYITGWSLNPKMVLVIGLFTKENYKYSNLNPTPSQNPQLVFLTGYYGRSEILKQKSHEQEEWQLVNCSNRKLKKA